MIVSTRLFAAAILVSLSIVPVGALAQSAPPPAVPAAAPAVVKGPVYGVLSLIGDRFEIVAEQSPVDALLDADSRASIGIDTPVFDSIAVSATADVVRRIQPNAELAAINTRSAVLFEKFRTLFAETGNTMAIPEAILEVLKEQQATHFILITKHRDNGRLRFANMAENAGRLEGLGFYLDASSITRNNVTLDLAKGYIAPYVYMRISLVDLKSMQVVKRQTVTASSVFSPEANRGSANPWNALTSAEKVRALDVLIRREITRVVPMLFSE
jgi:hypothetical protein